MTNKQLLIVSKNRSYWQQKLTAVSPDKYLITGAESLEYMSLGHHFAVILDFPEAHGLIKKVSLGICDNSACQSIWQLLASDSKVALYMFCEKTDSTIDPEMLQLGIEKRNLSGVISLFQQHESDPAGSTNGNLDNNFPAEKIITADDIRDMQKKGIRQIPAHAFLTPWAKEVADSLNIAQKQDSMRYLFPVEVSNLDALKLQRESIFELSNAHPEMLFIVNPLCLPVFNSLFPSLQGKTVSPSISWESHGAFTGETSASMLADMRCYGAIMPETAAYCMPERLLKTIELAQKHGLSLFSTFTLASTGSCDIIASEKYRSYVIPLSPKGMTGAAAALENGAMIVDREYLTQSAFRKGK